MKYIILFLFLLSISNFILLVDKIPLPVHIKKDNRKELISVILKDLGIYNTKERNKLSPYYYQQTQQMRPQC